MINKGLHHSFYHLTMMTVGASSRVLKIVFKIHYCHNNVKLRKQIIKLYERSIFLATSGFLVRTQKRILPQTMGISLDVPVLNSTYPS